MSYQVILTGPLTFAWLLAGTGLIAAEEDRVLFDFSRPDAAKQWQTVNDGVMGGISDGRVKITKDKKMEFFGTLSLENNGGFASVRTPALKLGLKQGDTLVVKVRGDGRQYSMNLYPRRRRSAFSYRAMFTTTKDKWIEVRLPLDNFVATSFGRIVRNQPLDPTEVNGIGILLGDKKAGPFRVEVEGIKVKRSRQQPRLSE